MVTVRSVLAIAAAKHWAIFQMDVHNAFLQGDLLEDYMEVPPGFASQGGSTVKVESELIVVLVYVDDLLVTGSNQRLILQTRNDLKLKFKMKDLGELKFFLGIEFARSSKGIVMSQRKYALELIAEMGLSGAKPAGTPLEANSSLEAEDKLLADAGKYQRLIGRLLNLTMTRVDIAYVVQVLSQHMHKPKQSHMEATLRVVRYIKGSPGLGLLMPSGDSGKLEGFCDSDWGGCLQTRRSVTGYLVKFGDALISWKSKKQETVARSSAEAEFMSTASAVAELTWLTRLFKELGVDVELPITLNCDSKAAIQDTLSIMGFI
ncbi:PREDICTED: uncharacterized protein LOC109220427 [Nicotiana attenuata]|uniref:uncharacterized protein LOC109220427 n=1 Tax=Nicotiana attenuata TaxID=49451 RepID=UPI000905A773|nr:PREDICTED: uncharacterized protein LOC109220427 [Nicotiana attenuata]